MQVYFKTFTSLCKMKCCDNCHNSRYGVLQPLFGEVVLVIKTASNLLALLTTLYYIVTENVKFTPILVRTF